MPRDGGILALDIATTTGFAYGYPGERPVWGHQRFAGPGAPDGEVGALFESWLETLIVRHRPAHIVVEAPYVPRALRPIHAGPPPFNIAVIRRLFGMLMVAQLVAHRRLIEFREESGQRVLKHLTGVTRWGGRQSKKDATKRMVEFYGFAPATEDEADAIAVWLYAEAMLSPAALRLRGEGPLFKSGTCSTLP